MDINKYATDFVDQMDDTEGFKPMTAELFFDQCMDRFNHHQKYFVCELIDHIEFIEKNMVDVWFKHLFWLLIRYIEIDNYRDSKDIISEIYILSDEFYHVFFQFKLYENGKIKDYVLDNLSFYYECNIDKDEFGPEFKATKIISGEYLERLCEEDEDGFGENVKYWILDILNDFKPSWADENYKIC